MLTLLVCLIRSMFVNPQKEYTDQSGFCRFLLNWSTFLVIRLFRIKIHVSGLDKVPKDQNFLLVSNHRSNYDPICTWYILKDHCISFLTKQANLKIPFYGRLIRRCCFYEISRTDVSKAVHAIDMASNLIRNTDISVGVYPEGSRQKNCVLAPFHSFVFRVAKQAHAPVVIMTVRGTENIHRNIPFRHTDVYVDFLQALEYESIAGRRSGEIGEKARNIMCDFLKSSEKPGGENEILLSYKQQSRKQQDKG